MNPSELYSGIIGLDQIPKVKARPRSPQVAMSIENDYSLVLDERVIVIEGRKLFVLNALLLNLGRQITRADVERLGFEPGLAKNTRQVAFSNTKKSLERDLVYGQPERTLLVQKFESNTAHYQLDPRVEYVFYDRRQENQ